MKHPKDPQARAALVKRRRFLKTVPAAVAAGLASPALAGQQAQDQPLRISKETLDCGES